MPYLLSVIIHEFCTPLLWRHLTVWGDAQLATMILRLRSNHLLAQHVHTVAFLDHVNDMEAWRKKGDVNFERCKRRIAEVWNGRKGGGGHREKDHWSMVDGLPGLLLDELNAHGASSTESFRWSI